MDKTYYNVGMRDKYSDANTVWITCLITEFIAGNADYLSTCGDVAKDHYPFGPLYLLLAFYYILTPLGNLWASFSKEARDKWYACYMKMRAVFSPPRRNDAVKVVPVVPVRSVIDLSKHTPPSTERKGSNDEHSSAATVEKFDDEKSSNKYKVVKGEGSEENA
jgi:hypothetical protein